MSLEITEEQIASWPPDAQAVVRLLMAEIAALRLEVAELRTEATELRAENVDLKKRLERHEGPKTPQNSSLPPSTQHPHAARRRKTASKRKRGGQPGHRKYERPLIPTEECDATKCSGPQISGAALR